MIDSSFFVLYSSFLILHFFSSLWSSSNAFIRSSSTGYNSSRIREVQARTPGWSLPVVDKEMLLTP